MSYSSSCASEFFDAEELPVDKHGHYQVVEEENLQIEEIDPEIRTHASDSSSEAGSLSSGEGSLSSESELGAEFTVVSNFVGGEGAYHPARGRESVVVLQGAPRRG